MESLSKVKLVVSDLHFGTGLSDPGGGHNSLEEFYFDEKFAEFLEYHTTAKFKDIEVELVLNGDIFNFLQIDYKGHFVPVITEAMNLNMLDRIAEGHPKIFKSLKKFASLEGKSITYVTGNHDQGILWPKVQGRLNEILETQVNYCQLVYYFDGVHIEHGHMHEAANRMNPKKFFLRKNLPEPILNLPFGSHFFVDFVLKLKQSYPHVDKVRPFRRMVRWVLFNETVFLIKSLFQMCKYFFLSAFGSSNHKNAWSVKTLFKIILESAIFPDLSDSARYVLKDERVHTVIFGHSHVYQYRQWGQGKEYFNTGTWTDIVSLDVSSLGKITKLTYVEIGYGADSSRPRGRLKEWRGYHRIEEDVVIC
ncbi:MAG: hypothetical protein ACRBBP_04125 [Bdellovibrionales bacterium]